MKHKKHSRNERGISKDKAIARCHWLSIMVQHLVAKLLYYVENSRTEEWFVELTEILVSVQRIGLSPRARSMDKDLIYKSLYDDIRGNPFLLHGAISLREYKDINHRDISNEELYNETHQFFKAVVKVLCVKSPVVDSDYVKELIEKVKGK